MNGEKLERALFRNLIERPILALDRLVELGMPKERAAADSGEVVLWLEPAEQSDRAINAGLPRAE